jgi:hypothetical protein
MFDFNFFKKKKVDTSTQEERVFDLLFANRGEWVDVWRINKECRVLHYTGSIRNLRKRLKDTKDENGDYKLIEHKLERTVNKL